MENGLTYINYFTQTALKLYNHCGVGIKELHSFSTAFNSYLISRKLLDVLGRWEGSSCLNHANLWTDTTHSLLEIEELAYEVEYEILKSIRDTSLNNNLEELNSMFCNSLVNYGSAYNHNLNSVEIAPRCISRRKLLGLLRRKIYNLSGIDVAEGLVTGGETSYKIDRNVGMGIDFDFYR
jgi:hypothetical protein